MRALGELVTPAEAGVPLLPRYGAPEKKRDSRFRGNDGTHEAGRLSPPQSISLRVR
jgi:hypothetical protein